MPSLNLAEIAWFYLFVSDMGQICPFMEIKVVINLKCNKIIVVIWVAFPLN